jgi:hypothetical protein
VTLILPGTIRTIATTYSSGQQNPAVACVLVSAADVSGGMKTSELPVVDKMGLGTEESEK